MSKTKSLTPVQIEEVKKLVMAGTQPQKIADKYKIGISTVHNYKKKFKAEGMEFASVRGRQPNATSLPRNIQPNRQTLGQAPSHSVTQAQPNNLAAGGSVFIVNGSTIQITSEAKSVSIDKSPNGVVFKIII